jgi:putative CocE/NonD family hydrolase
MAEKRKNRNLSQTSLGTVVGVASAAILGIGAYILRRRMIARFMKLQPPRYGVKITRRIMVPMPDGVHLSADLYQPKGGRLFPTVLIRTPYGRGGPVGPTGILHDFVGNRFAERGYNVFIQDVRGCYESQGDFKPFFHEAEDGRATIEWIEKQPWFNGIMGMWGPSYLGYTQWAVAGSGPLYLKAIVPVITGSNLPYSGFRDGALTLDTVLRWIIQLDALDRKGYLRNWFGLRYMRPAKMDRIINRSSMLLPLSDIDKKTIGKPVPFLQEWMEHLDPEDPYWEQFDHSKKLTNVTASTHLISGWYDIFLREQLDDYHKLRTNGQSPYLTIGPWHHLDSHCLLESIRQSLVWFDVNLKGERHQLRSKPVLLYVMGSGGWRELDSWPPPSTETRYYLHWHDDAQITTDPGLSSEMPLEPLPADRYTYDPDDPTPSIGGPVMSMSAGRVDNTGLESRSDVLTYTSAPLEESLDVIGNVSLRLFTKSSVEHCDYFARLLDVHPDGKSINICDGLARVKPGSGDLLPDGSRMVEIDMWATAVKIQVGHRIRLMVSSGAHPRYYRNLGTNEPLTNTAKVVPSEHSIYHDPDHPSCLLLPVTSS